MSQTKFHRSGAGSETIAVFFLRRVSRAPNERTSAQSKTLVLPDASEHAGTTTSVPPSSHARSWPGRALENVPTAGNPHVDLAVGIRDGSAALTSKASQDLFLLTAICLTTQEVVRASVLYVAIFGSRNDQSGVG